MVLVEGDSRQNLQITNINKIIGLQQSKLQKQSGFKSKKKVGELISTKTLRGKKPNNSAKF